MGPTKSLGKVSLASFPLEFIPDDMSPEISPTTSRSGRRGFVAGDSVLQKLHDDLKLCNHKLENADRVFEDVNAGAFNAYSSSNGDQKA
ncbi:hypothetical protein Tco_1380515 [Tanacetum coccineum]